VNHAAKPFAAEKKPWLGPPFCLKTGS
jgi:hypothetical protein